jgi:transposase
LDTDTGELSEPYTMATAQVAEGLIALPGTKRVVMEAGDSSFFLARKLKSCGVEVVVVDAYKAHRLLEACQGAKTDQLDATTLAVLLAQGYLDSAVVWVCDDYIHQLRELTRYQQELTKDSTRVRNRMRGLLRRQGRVCPYSDLLGKAAGKWLEQAVEVLPERIGMILQGMRSDLAAKAEQLQQVTEVIAAEAQANTLAGLLQTVPGIGPLLALTMVAEIGDIRRFETAQKLRGYSGLVPVVRQSGERRYTGPLKKRGNQRLRWALVMAAGHFAASTKTRELSLAARYRYHVYKHGPNPAKVALARRLVDIIFAMLRDQTVFDSPRYRTEDVA